MNVDPSAVADQMKSATDVVALSDVRHISTIYVYRCKRGRKGAGPQSIEVWVTHDQDNRYYVEVEADGTAVANATADSVHDALSFVPWEDLDN